MFSYRTGSIEFSHQKPKDSLMLPEQQHFSFSIGSIEISRVICSKVTGMWRNDIRIMGILHLPVCNFTHEKHQRGWRYG